MGVRLALAEGEVWQPRVRAERQWRDVLGILKTQGEGVDIAYLREWAMALGVAELLERALVQLGR